MRAAASPSAPVPTSRTSITARDPFREILLLYWSKRGPDGFTVLAPFYWHFWSPATESRVIAPFYWHFADYARGTATTVILPGLPVSWSRGPGTARSFAIWPLFYASNRFGWALPLFGTFAVSDPDAGTSTGAVAFLYWWRRTPARSFDLAFPLFISSRTAEHAFTFALPLNFYWRNGDDSHTLAIPFFYASRHKTGSSFYTWVGYHRREETEHSGSLLWLYWFGANQREGSRYDVLFPLLWSFGDKQSGVTVFAPLLWHFRSPESTTTVLVPFLHVRQGDTSLSALVPLVVAVPQPKDRRRPATRHPRLRLAPQRTRQTNDPDHLARRLPPRRRGRHPNLGGAAAAVVGPEGSVGQPARLHASLHRRHVEG